MNLKKATIIATIIILIIIGGVEIYYSTQPPPLISEVPPRIVSHNSYITNGTGPRSFVVIGVVQNNLKTSIRSVNVTATFYDADDVVTGTKIGRPLLDMVEPEQRTPFEIYLSLEPSMDAPAKYELVLSYVKTSKETIAGLEIIDQTASIDKYGNYRVNGVIQNKGERKANLVSVVCTYYNSEGKVMAISRTHVSSEIEPGEEEAFETSSKPHKIVPASYELLIVTQRYDPIFITNTLLLIILIAAFAVFLGYMKHRGW